MQKTIERLVAKIANTKSPKQLAEISNEKGDAVIQIKGFQNHDQAREFTTGLIATLRKEKWRVKNEKHILGDPKAKQIEDKTDLSQYELAHDEKGEIHVAFAGHPQSGYLARITLKNTQITE